MRSMTPAVPLNLSILYHTVGKDHATVQVKVAAKMQAPEAAASAATREVLPTPGEPSSRTALRSCSARSTRPALRAVVGAPKSKRAAPPALVSRGFVLSRGFVVSFTRGHKDKSGT